MAIGLSDIEIMKAFKKYASLQNEILVLVQTLKENPQQETSIGNNCYKIRLAIASNF